MDSVQNSTVTVNARSVSVNPLLVILLSAIFFVLGGLTVYLLLGMNSDTVIDSEDLLADVPTNTETMPTVIDDLIYSSTFYVERDLQSPSTRSYFNATLPENVEVMYGTEGTTGGRTILSLDGSNLIEFTIPHIAQPSEVTEYEEIGNTEFGILYRIKSEDLSVPSRGTLYFYTDDLSFERGDDKCPVEIVENLPCSNHVLSLGIFAVFVGDVANLSIADEIMGSLSLISN